MPSFERTKGDQELRFEILLDEHRVYVCELYRALGETKWTTKHNNPRCYMADDAAGGKALYDEKIKALPKAFKQVSDETTEAQRFRDESDKQRTALFKAMDDWEAQHEQVTVLDQTGRVYWVGQTDKNKDQFMEITLDGTTVTVRKGKIGKKGTSEKETHRNREAALRSATISMMTSMNILKLGPETT